jgi:hypothetical protein
MFVNKIKMNIPKENRVKNYADIDLAPDYIASLFVAKI